MVLAGRSAEANLCDEYNVGVLPRSCRGPVNACEQFRNRTPPLVGLVVWCWRASHFAVFMGRHADCSSLCSALPYVVSPESTMYQVRCRTQIRRPEVNAEKPISCRAASGRAGRCADDVRRPARDAGSKMHRAARAYGSTEARRAVPIYERTELPATNGVMRAAPTRSSLSHCRVRNVRNKSRLLTASLLSESRAPPAIVRDLICGAAHLPLFLRVSAERSADRPDLARSLHSPLSSQPALFTYLRRPPSLA